MRHDKDECLLGGTAMIISGGIVGRFVRRIPDTMGRYSYMVLRGRDGSDMLIIIVYRVCQKTGTKVGHDTAFMQQYGALREKRY